MTSTHCTTHPIATPATRRELAAAAALMALLLLALRLPLLDHPTPVDPDEVRFTAALGFPAPYPVHHPGYPLWIAMGTAVNALGLGPYASFQLWSILASLAAPLLLYLGLRWLMVDTTAWWLALAFGLNPLLWFQATTALSYPAGGAVGLLVVGLCYGALITRRTVTACWAAAVLAIGVALRPDLLVYLGPMLAYVAWRSRRRGGVAAMLILVVGFVAYAGLTSWLYARNGAAGDGPHLGHTFDVILGTSVFKLGLLDGLARNLVKTCLNLGWDLGAAVVLLPPAAWIVARHRRDWPAKVPAILLLWVLPIGLFLLLMHVVQGYFMLLLPACYCLIGLALEHRFKPATATRIAAAIALCSFLQFTCYPWSAQSTGFKRLLDAKITFQSASGLRQIDRRAEIHKPGDFWHTAAYGD